VADPLLPRTPRVAVGAVVFREGRVLLVRRGQPPGEGSWAIPGGKVGLGETLREAAERELFEETGIRIRAGELVLLFDLIDRDPEGRVRFHYVIADFRGEYLSGDPAPGDDVAEARWVSEEDLAGLSVSPPTRRLLAERYRFGC